jgi:hypothetical protein
MKISQLQTALKALLPNRKNCIAVSGPPGGGKSSAFRQVAAEMGWEFLDIRAVLLDPVDFRGVPTITEDGFTKFCPPDFFPRKGCKPTLMLFDEMDKAPMLTQCGLLQLTLDRRCGEYEVPDNVYIASAMNRQSDRAGSQKLNTALANRFIHLDLEEDHQDWHNWALENDVHQSVRAFLQWRPSHLLQFDPSSATHAQATPRSWEFVSNVLHSLGDQNDSIVGPAVIGCVGPGIGNEFITFRRVYEKLPNIDGIFKNPNRAATEHKPDVMFAVLSAMVDKLRNDPTLAQPYCKYVVRLAKEFTAIALRDAIRSKARITDCDEFRTWVKENTALFA